MTRITMAGTYSECSGGETSKSAVQLRRGGTTWFVRQGWSERLAGPGAPNCFALEADPRAACVKKGHARSTWRVTLDDGVIYAKVFERGGLAERLKRLLLGNSAEREWRVSREAEGLGVPVARPIALGVSLDRTRREVFVTEGIQGTASLAEAWEQGAVSSTSRTRRATGQRLIDAVAVVFAVAHERGFIHGDAHPKNILVETAQEGRLEPTFVDLHSARVGVRPSNLKRSAESLAQLDQYFRHRATRTERLRFLRAYLRERPSMSRLLNERANFRGLLSAIARSTASGAAKLARTRDRRLRGDGKYFCRLALANGWYATAVLLLGRRYLFPEQGVPDRTESDWRTLLSRVTAEPGSNLREADPSAGPGLRVDIERPRGLCQRLWITLRGSGQYWEFIRCHKLRHRDVASDAILAYVEHRRGGLVDLTILIRPACAPGTPSSLTGRSATPGARQACVGVQAGLRCEADVPTVGP